MKLDIQIRPVRKSDVPAILDIYRPHIVEGWASFEEVVPTHEQMWQRIMKNCVDNPWLVATLNHGVIGYAYANAHRWRAAYRWAREVSVYVSPDSQNHGAASALYTKLLALLKAQGICTALAGIVIPNEASIGFHEKFGFELIAKYANIGFKHGTWYDTTWWQLQLQRPDQASEPIAYSQLSTEQIQLALMNG